MELNTITMQEWDGTKYQLVNSTKPKTFKTGTILLFLLGITYAQGETQAKKIRYKIYVRPIGSTEKFDLAKDGECDLIRGGGMMLNTTELEEFADAELAISFGLRNPYEYPFKDTKGVKYFNVQSSCYGAPNIISVIWSNVEKIQFGKLNPVRSNIFRNEDGFLHIHTHGMYKKFVNVEIYEHDRFGDPKSLKTYNNKKVLYNVLYLPVSMKDIYLEAQQKRSAEANNYDLFARVTPVSNSRGSKDSGMLYLSIQEATLSKTAKSTIDGVRKFVIGESTTGKKSDIKVYKLGDKGNVVREINFRLAGFGGLLPGDSFTELTVNGVKQFQQDYMKMQIQTGEVDAETMKSIDLFCSTFSENVTNYKCTCGSCEGFGKGQFIGKYHKDKYGKLRNGEEAYHDYEYPGIHQSLLWGVSAARYYASFLSPKHTVCGINSGYRCWVDNIKNSRNSTNHMGKAVDLQFKKAENIISGKVATNLPLLTYIKDNLFVKYLKTTLWTKPGFSTEPIGLGEGQTWSWIHLDVRTFGATNLKDEYFIKSNTEENFSKKLSDINN